MVNVMGLGYIGLPTALMMASHGVEVVGTNHSQGKVDMLKSGKTTFKEKHNEIKENMDKLVGKIVLDCHNVCSNISCYKL